MPHFPQVGGIFLVHDLHKGRRATMATDAIAATIAAFTTAMAAEYSLPVLPRCSRPHHFGRLAAILLIFGPRCTRPDLEASLQPSSFWCLAAALLILGPRCQPPHFGASLHSSGFKGLAEALHLLVPRCSRPHHFGRLAANLLILGLRCTRPDLHRRESQEFRTVEGRNIATAEKFAITRQLH